MQQTTLPEHPPQVGDLVHIRSRRWLVEEVVESSIPGGSARVQLACADDDNQGAELTVYWDYELDRRVLKEEDWTALASKGFDPPDQFGAFLHTLRWNCITATDPNLFQSPFRAGIKIDAYQMEPLRKALQLPRVNLFIADDTGLGKTIEAGLIARELLLRKKVKTIVVGAPASVIEQWKGELEDRFGLVFEILDRAYLARVRKERGFGVNPWSTHSRFLISHNLLSDSSYADPMRSWLGPLLPGSLLILDEAHHAAPSSGGRYGIESKFTKAIRDLAGRFEHRLFLSATPHNGHSNSFSTLLELLDPYRFTRGVPIKGREQLEDVMVRRLKEDIREVQGGFPKRNVVRVELAGLPQDAPELVLSGLLDEYRTVREERFKSASRRSQTAAGLVVVGLQQRLLSSVDAFARSLKVHRATVEREWEKASAPSSADGDSDKIEGLDLLTASPTADDEWATWTEEELDEEEAAQIEAATTLSEADAEAIPTQALREKELKLIEQMQEIADGWRDVPDAKVRFLVDWIRENMCPDLPPAGSRVKGAPPRWNDRRVLIFTENREGTKRYLKRMLEQAIDGTDQADDRIEVIDGLVGGPRRREIQQRFNTDPAKDPLRILLATDAAREGLNFQAHCTDLFHFDLPWNPGRIEQRNGRIDRKLQPAQEVRCHYFVLPQRVEDHVLEVLVRKTEAIRKELGSLAQVIDDRIERRLRSGIRHSEAEAIANEIDNMDLDEERKAVTAEELDTARERRDELLAQIARCQELLENSRQWVGFDARPFRSALSCSLELLNAPPLGEDEDEDGRTVWRFPALDQKVAGDSTWAATLDSLRVPRNRGQKLEEWRREAPIRPVVFADTGLLSDETVHLHLEQRVAQRLLARFRSQGFVYHDLSRACLAQAVDSMPRVLLIGRLSLYGTKAERLHEQMVYLPARWEDSTTRTGRLVPDGDDERALTLLEGSLEQTDAGSIDPVIQKRLLESAPKDLADLLPLLDKRAKDLAKAATRQLKDRGNREEAALRRTLEAQRRRVAEKLAKYEKNADQLTLDFDVEEKRQLEADAKAWKMRLEQFSRDIETEPERVKSFYDVRVQRVDPVGLVYLWPETN